jgi:hypothetical protein
MESRKARAQRTAFERTNGRAVERVCEHCRDRGNGQHQSAAAPKGKIVCNPCCVCGGDGYYFEIIEVEKVICVWDLLGEPRPRECPDL